MSNKVCQQCRYYSHSFSFVYLPTSLCLSCFFTNSTFSEEIDQSVIWTPGWFDKKTAGGPVNTCPPGKAGGNSQITNSYYNGSPVWIAYINTKWPNRIQVSQSLSLQTNDHLQVFLLVSLSRYILLLSCFLHFLFYSLNAPLKVFLKG